MKKKFVIPILILIFISAGAFSAYQIYREYLEYDEGTGSYTDLKGYVKIPEVPQNTAEEPADSSESEGEPISQIAWPVVDFASLLEINPDCVAWIQIDGTEINYPVVQGTDNQYYLKHLFEGKWNSSGCIFLDSRVAEDLSDRHSIIYGHYMKNGSMFSGLTKYKEQQYYEAHPSGYLLMPDENYTIEFFAGYVASANADAWNLDFESDEEYMAWIDRAIEQSCFESPVRPVADSRIVTLSTCSYEFKNARFILLGIIK